MEIELKLLVRPQDTATLRELPLLRQYAAGPARELQMSDTYFDTARQQLKQAGAGLRVRRVGDEFIQTLKAGGDASAGLHRRYEWESKVPGAEPDLPALRAMVDRKAPWSKLLRAPATESRLVPIFQSQVTRSLWDLRLPDGDRVEFALDIGKLECGDEAVPVSEIELELKSGNAIHLFDLALALHERLPMHIGTMSKVERGYSLCRPHPRMATANLPVLLAKGSNVEQAFKAIAANCLAQIQANAAGVVHDYNGESLHQMRVGLRRLRSALDVFKDVVQLPAEIGQDVDWLAHELGNARDWDVLAGSTLPLLAKHIPAAGPLLDVTHAALDSGRDAHLSAAAAVNSPRYTKLMLSLGRWMFGNGWREPGTGRGKSRLDAPVAGFASKVLRRAHKRMKKRGRALSAPTPETLHRARIAAKKARYASEFFASLYRGKQVRRYVRALGALQDELGKVHDATVGEGLLGQMENARHDLAGAIAPVRAALAERAAGSGGKARKLWKRFTAVKLPR
ncbi:CHAD domain-containing protein [Massilia sp. RP-1-19]|uniref:CHAD domain-containing protein n=1 Tax=Massilia polaris TaxID=2728846 RepID=A0A848HLF7_9BURK|nr:CYTH and CHAD domain-containing protein [Massilia polaris]NML60751.1 CHAD domain-containing protein [Massilia polaris]